MSVDPNLEGQKYFNVKLDNSTMNRADIIDQPFYLCTGFHRSGTSLVASTLASNGVNLGSQLMGPSFANPNGHFEDIPVVNLHDQILQANATDWRFYEDRPLKVSAFFQAKIQTYYEQRKAANSEQSLIGVKDPRAVFLIDNWYQATNKNLKTLLVYRDWRYAISSLFKRHSRELLQFTTPIEQRKLDYQFWQHAELAAKMWLASANAMLNWVKKHPQDTLLFEQNAFISEQQTLKQRAQEKGIEPQVLDCQLFDSSLMQSNIPQSMVDMIPNHIQHLCHQAQQKLNDLADVCCNESVDTSATDPLTLAVLSEIKSGADNPLEALNIPPQISLANLCWEDAIETLRALPNDQNLNIDWSELFCRENLKGTDYDALYVVAVKFKQWMAAENAIHRAMEFKPYHYRCIHLADMYMRRKIPVKAKQYYQMAQQLAPNNSVPLAKLSEVESLLGNIELARSLLQQAEQLDSEKPAVKQAQKRLEQKVKQLAPEQTSPDIEGKMYSITDYQQVVTAMSESVVKGKALDQSMVKTAFMLRNNKDWLIKGCENLPVNTQRCLLDYLFAHLRKFWPETILSTELNLADAHISQDLHLDVPYSSETIRIGVSIHVYHAHLLPGLISFVNYLPHFHKVVITCPKECITQTNEFLGLHKGVEIVEVDNRGRDILPWLCTANKFEDCDIAVKLHTKSTPHSAALCGWRLQLLSMLLGDKTLTNSIVDAFANKPQLGMVIPNFHPHIAKHINWGENRNIAEQLAQTFNITLPEDISVFPAGSMFWYRPKALAKLTSHSWNKTDFPEETGQIDGTIMHALERILCFYTQQQGYEVEFSQNITLI